MLAKKQLFYCLLSMMLVFPTHAWNALGHRLIAQIAYNHLSPATKSFVNHYNQRLDLVYRHQSFVNAAPWMDSLRYVQNVWMKPFHYIDLPFSNDGSPLMPPEEANALVAILTAQSVLKDPKSSDFDKGFSLRILLHVIGDLHQPLHASNQFSRQHPKGDQGGNLFYLGFDNPIGRNLHTYWDQGGGFLSIQPAPDDQTLAQLAQTIEEKWPCHLDKMTDDPKAWSEESFQLAVNKAYTTPYNQPPSLAYQAMTQAITQERIALAGCRIAKVVSDSDR